MISLLRWVYVLPVAGSVLAIDRLTKFIAVNKLSGGDSAEVLPGIFHLTLVHNRGAAFGLFSGQNTVFIIFSVIVVAAVAYFISAGMAKSFIVLTALALISGGAIGNLMDRISLGYVIDFFDFRIWPVFNVADIAISTGALLVILYASYSIKSRKC